MDKIGNDRVCLVCLFKATLLAVLLVVLCVLVWHDLPPEWLDSRWLAAWIKSMGILAPLAYILLRTVAIVLTVVPNAPLDVAGGVLFGPFLGTVYSLIGSEAGAIACYLLAHALGREAITRLLHREIVFSGHYPQRQLAYIVLFARLRAGLLLCPRQLRCRSDRHVAAGLCPG